MILFRILMACYATKLFAFVKSPRAAVFRILGAVLMMIEAVLIMMGAVS
jgi:hypothetical protein